MDRHADFQDRTFPTLNAVRAIGAIMVVLTHSAFNTGQINQGWTGAALARLDFGVTLFFVLSGFLLSRPWFLTAALGRPAPSSRHYLWKRALRILPLYWVVVVVALAFDPANDQMDWRDWLANLTFTQLYRADLLPSSLTQMWSLCTEVAFYVVLPLLCWLLTKQWRGERGHRLHLPTVLTWSVVLFVLGVAWQAWVAQIPGNEGHYAQWLPGYLPWFLVGVWFAAVSASLAVDPRDHVLERLGHDLVGCWILATAVFAIACSPLAGPRTLLTPGGWEAGPKVVLYAIAGALYVLPLVFGPVREGWVRTQLSGPVLFWLGEISYGVFAIHMLVLNAVFSVLDIGIFTGRFLTVAGTTLGVTIVIATASYYLYERPIMRWKNLRFFARMDAESRPERATVH
ncbi:acyltransferase family protein [Nocardioides mangrovi]|uniref:Acyltransferase n=1 Tax=Nocardioides mangrovi TaxID=2874580 RepID=A0ABS7U7R0_9ACTN|nr:acyltransferase [Nocardioides mangrovi]MBZ5736880.1 acyltransferase [Nocardioides mangrovi]